MAILKNATQEKLADALQISQQDVSKLIRKGFLTKGASLGQWLIEYGRHMREVAAGWKSQNGDLDLIQEKARLAKAQSEKTEFELKKSRSEFLPKNLIIHFMESRFAIVRGRLLSLPSRMKGMVPELPVSAFIKMTDLIREVLTELSHDRIPPEMREKFNNWMEYGEDSQVKKNQEGK